MANNLESLRDAIIKKVIEGEDLRRVVTTKRVKNRDPVAIIGEMDAVGHAGAGCNPTNATRRSNVCVTVSRNLKKRMRSCVSVWKKHRRMPRRRTTFAS